MPQKRHRKGQRWRRMYVPALKVDYIKRIYPRYTQPRDRIMNLAVQPATDQMVGAWINLRNSAHANKSLSLHGSPSYDA